MRETLCFPFLVAVHSKKELQITYSLHPYPLPALPTPPPPPANCKGTILTSLTLPELFLN